MLTLVIGGAASGKSEYAESLVLRSTLPRYYLATMQVWDAECAARVEKHRRMRAAKQFETVECPLHLDAVHLPARGTALLEDLGNLTANELYDPAGAGPQTAQAILSGLDAVYAQCETLIVVSNEVFSGGADYAGDTDRYLLALAGEAEDEESEFFRAGLAYALSKKFVIYFTQKNVVRFAQKHCRILSISPGCYLTPMHQKLIDNQPETAENQLELIPAGRWGHPYEMGALTAFLCSHGAGYINGVDILADGGQNAGIFVPQI